MPLPFSYTEVKYWIIARIMVEESDIQAVISGCPLSGDQLRRLYRQILPAHAPANSSTRGWYVNCLLRKIYLFKYLINFSIKIEELVLFVLRNRGFVIYSG